MVSLAGGAVKSFLYAGSLGEFLPPRWAYLIQLVLGFLGVVFLRLFGSYLFGSFPLVWKAGVSENTAVIVVFFAFVIYHFIMACCLLGVTSSSEGRSMIHNCFWPIKSVFWAIFAVFIWLSVRKAQEAMIVAIWAICLVFGCLFLVAEGFAVICISSSLNEWLVEKASDGQKSCVFALVALMVLFGGVFVALSFSVGTTCNAGVKVLCIFLNFIVVLVQLGTNAVPRVRAANPRTNITFILASSLFTLFLLTSSWEAVAEAKNAFYGKANVFIHCIFLLIALIQETIELAKEDEESKSVLAIPAAATSPDESKSAETPAPSEEKYEDFCYSKQHYLYCFISALLIPVLCNWKWEGIPIIGKLSMGFSLFSFFIVHLLVFWVLLAPLVLSSREF